MKFMCGKKNYSIIIRKSYFKRYADGARELVPGLKVRFVGSHRIFDSEQAQEQHEWTDKDRVFVEDWILKNKRFNKTIFLAPGQQLSQAQVKIASSLPTAFRPRCQEIWTEGTEVKQCANDTMPSKDFCTDHDPKQVKISRGALTTVPE